MEAWQLSFQQGNCSGEISLLAGGSILAVWIDGMSPSLINLEILDETPSTHPGSFAPFSH